jgi:acetyltransferase-like isoleucine patch superfamily enzyme
MRDFMVKGFLRWCPGALGLLLRQKFYPRFFKSCGKGILFGRFLDLIHTERIILGDHVVLNNRACLDGTGSTSSEINMVIGKAVFIGEGTTLNCRGGRLTVHSGANLSSCCAVHANTDLIIGRKVLVAAYCVIGEDEHRGDVLESLKEKKPTIIGDGCWLGVRSEVARGTSIGKGTIIGAHSLVVDDLGEQVICFGQPATLYQSRTSDSEKKRTIS